jgi:hypothetical protein
MNKLNLPSSKCSTLPWNQQPWLHERLSRQRKSLAWSWSQINERVLKLQRIIYKNSKEGNVRMVRRYQHLLIASQDAKLLAIRRVTQDNTGKNTAGVDGIKTLSPRPPWEVFPGPAPCRSL